MGTNSEALQEQTRNSKTWGFISVWIQNFKHLWRLISGGNAGMEEFKKSGTMINLEYWNHEFLKNRSYSDISDLDVTEIPKFRDLGLHIRKNYVIPLFSVFQEGSHLNEKAILEKTNAFIITRTVYENLDKDPILMEDPSLAFFIAQDMTLEILKSIETDRSVAFILNVATEDLIVNSRNRELLSSHISARDVTLFNLIDLIMATGIGKNRMKEDLFYLDDGMLVQGMLKLITIIYGNTKAAISSSDPKALISNFWAIECARSIEIMIMKPIESFESEKESEGLLEELKVPGVELPEPKSIFDGAKFSKPIDRVLEELIELRTLMLRAIPEYWDIIKFHKKNQESHKLKDDDFE